MPPALVELCIYTSMYCSSSRRAEDHWQRKGRKNLTQLEAAEYRAVYSKVDPLSQAVSGRPCSPLEIVFRQSFFGMADMHALNYSSHFILDTCVSNLFLAGDYTRHPSSGVVRGQLSPSASQYAIEWLKDSVPEHE